MKMFFTNNKKSINEKKIVYVILINLIKSEISSLVSSEK